MKKYISLISLLILSLVSCTNELENFFTGGEVTTINVSAEEFQSSTRTAINKSNYAVNWSEGDIIGIFPMEEGSRQIAFDIKSGSGSSSASFDGKGWGLKSGTEYVAYYPCSSNAFLDKTSIALDYTGQTQNGNGDTSHLGTYDFLKTASTQAVNGSLDLQFEHIGTLVHLTLNVPNGTYKKVELHTDGTFYSKAFLNLETGNTLPDEDSETKTMTLNLNNVSVSDGKLEIFTMIYPVDLEGSNIYSYAYDEEGNNVSTTTWKGVEFQPSTVWNGEELIPIPYLTFDASSVQTLQLLVGCSVSSSPYAEVDHPLDFAKDYLSNEYYNALNSIEYSLDGGSWSKLGSNKVTFGGPYGNIRLRGKTIFGTGYNGECKIWDTNNKRFYSTTRLQHATFSFGNTIPVNSSGDIRTLVDYDNYDVVDASNVRYNALFNGSSQLIAAPSLPSLTLADNCYDQMFKGCEQLQVAPALPSSMLAISCYRSMFEGCTNLTNAPLLPAEELKSSCYNGMFKDCKNLTVAPILSASIMQSGCYQVMFDGCTKLETAPSLPATTLAEGCYWGMFQNCSNLKSAPELPATTPENSCYMQMFMNCTSLETAPDLIAPNAALISCYARMFYGCTKLNYIKMTATNWIKSSSPSLATFYNWATNVSPKGTFVKNAEVQNSELNGIVPSGWTIIDEKLNTINGHEYVDLGIVDANGNTVYWATTNVGANNPWDYGGYYAWGETKAYGEEDTSNAHNYAYTGNTTYTKTYYSWDTYKWTTGDSWDSIFKYCLDDNRTQCYLFDKNGNYVGEHYDNLSHTKLDAKDDAATVNWGESWRMPTYYELEELSTKCCWVWVNSYKGNTVNGYVIYEAKCVADKGYYGASPSESYSVSTDAHIFLPVAGMRLTPNLRDVGNYGYYWSSELSSASEEASHLVIYSTRVGLTLVHRYYGFSIRPVYVKQN